MLIFLHYLQKYSCKGMPKKSVTPSEKNKKNVLLTSIIYFNDSIEKD